MNMKAIITLLSSAYLVVASAEAQNLLINGDFNSPNSAAAPDSWSLWPYGGGWANHQSDGHSFDGSFYMAVGGGNSGSSGGGLFQNVSATAGNSYTLSVESGVDAWWWPQGEMRLFFLDASNNTLADNRLDVTTAISGYDTGLPWTLYTLTATAPLGTTQAKIEFASQSGTGTVWFDNAMFTAVPEPGALALLAVGSAFLFRRTRHS
jgi:hypothetical protein